MREATRKNETEGGGQAPLVDPFCMRVSASVGVATTTSCLGLNEMSMINSQSFNLRAKRESSEMSFELLPAHISAGLVES